MDKENFVVSFQANKKWLSIPKEMRSELEKNVWCSSCTDVISIANYQVKETDFGIVLQGNCHQCSKPVARSIEID
ncbi:hypothetical protein CHI02_05485 [Niallia circulans]|uniref:hypothetical protein n=1 Tax=Niallia circulans TaxID=1397 RepID=UPI000BA55E90|nr:hypothetical protein [Niallia circulans]PAE13300.1 hypothetical protein CHI02_05485 [Niallia circulans]